MAMLDYVWNDGGRSLAGFKGYTGDCVCRATAIATGHPYQEIYDLINDLGKQEKSKQQRSRSTARTGVHKETTRLLMSQLGGVWTPTMTIGSGCQVHLQKGQLPSGSIVCQLSHHVVAVIDEVVHDISDPRRGGSRCVYGYWTFK